MVVAAGAKTGEQTSSISARESRARRPALAASEQTGGYFVCSFVGTGPSYGSFTRAKPKKITFQTINLYYYYNKSKLNLFKMSDGQNIQIFVRCRPLKNDERAASLNLDPERQVVRIDSQNREFQFDQVFAAKTPQEDVYSAVVKPLIPQVLQGFNCAVLAYGQTGTGKTYTMEGERSSGDTEADKIGIIPRAVGQIFQLLRQGAHEFSVHVSFLELYSEEAYDLLSSPEDTSKLRIFDDKNKQRSVKIEGLKEITVNSESDIFEVLARGSNKRQTAATLINACSSRSHSIFTITVSVKMDIMEDREITKIGKLNLVDLAGSENIARSGAQNKHAREAGNINQSLLTLTRVITALVEKRPHIPYRESKLTRILQDSLGGATRTSMIATISPAEIDSGNTVGTLDYASRARKITNRPESNRQMTSRKTSDLEEYKIQLESELESRIRNEVAMDFRRETDKIREQYKRDLEDKTEPLAKENLELRDRNIDLTREIEKFKEQIEQIQSERRDQLDKEKQYFLELQNKDQTITRETEKFKDELTRVSSEKEQQLVEEKKRVIELQDKNQELSKQIKILNYMLNDKQQLIENIRRDFKKREDELLARIAEPPQSTVLEEPVPEPVPKKAAKLSKRAPVQEDDYANMTFTGDDEIIQVSAKKTRSKIAAEPKQRQDLTLSGKKRKLTNYGGDIDLSPISPPVRVTRSRNTRRKLAY